MSARAGQILEAAKQLRLNHATVARQLAALEESLIVKLLERHSARCALTVAGEDLIASAERAESEFLKVGPSIASDHRSDRLARCASGHRMAKEATFSSTAWERWRPNIQDSSFISCRFPARFRCQAERRILRLSSIGRSGDG
ncbi:LysR family transcriptional regulator [Bradyrhizobium hereditatis]|uniref:LysR family transcriptional regulator n=1 Tax=Bradyrhizobium hereditatis TaxID=2821405 RepID=UPI0035E37387